MHVDLRLRLSQTARLPRSTLAMALAMGLGFPALTMAQSTTGSIFGSVPVAQGTSIQITGSTGLTRDVPIDAQGRYRAGNLPLGSYTVNLMKDGQVIDSRKNINLTVGAGSDVSFTSAPSASAAQSLESVTVRANSLPPVDVSTVDPRTVVTAEPSARLPLGRNAQSIALLAPGRVTGRRARDAPRADLRWPAQGPRQACADGLGRRDRPPLPQGLAESRASVGRRR